jgi:O-antigen/teichoic acid export membrane protein
MVAGTLAGRTVYVVLTSYWKPVPWAIPRWSQVLAPLRFGLEVATSRLAWAAYTQCDALIVARVQGSSALGSYRFAINFASIPAEKIGTLIMRVTGPLFARIQDDRKLVHRYFLIISEALTLVIFPLSFGMAIVAPDLVRVVLGPKWSGAIGPMQCLALFMAFRDISTLFGQILTSQRRTRFLMWISILNFVVMPVSFYIASRWGATAIAAAWIVMSPITILPTAVRLFRTIDCTFPEYMRVLAAPLLGSAAMVCAVFALRAWLLPPAWPSLWRLIAQAATGGAAYAAVLLGPYRPRVLRYVRFFLQLRKDRKVTMESAVAEMEGLG